MKKIVVGLGEVLWDILSERRYPGGAPANFAYITCLLGDHGIVASRVGTDALGRDALSQMDKLGLPLLHVQSDEAHPTGTARAEVDTRGEARFEIADGAAWDFLEWTPQWQRLAEEADAVCFGSLAQRSVQSRETIRRFLGATRLEAVPVFDVNLRQPFHSYEVLARGVGARISSRC